MKIKHIEIEGLHNISKLSEDFDNITNITGPNGSGKSTILQAVQFAFLGYFPDYSKTQEGILAHSNSDKISVKLTLTDSKTDFVISRSISKSGRSYDKKLSVEPDIYSGLSSEDQLTKLLNSGFIFVDFSEFIGLSANKQKEALTDLLPASNVDITPQYLLNQVKDVCDADVESIDDEMFEGYETIKSIEDLKSLNKKLKEFQSFYNQSSKRIENTIKSLIYYDDYEGPESQDLMDEWNALSSKLTSLSNSIAMLESTNNQISEFPQIYTEDEIEGVKEEIKNISSQIYDLTNKKNEALSEKSIFESDNKHYSNIKKGIENGGICPYTSEKCAEILNKSEETYYQLKIIKSKLEENLKMLDFLSEQIDAYQLTLTFDITKVSEMNSSNIRNKNLREDIAYRISKLPEEYSKDIELPVTTKQQLDEIVTKLNSEKAKLTAKQSEISDSLKKAVENESFQTTQAKLLKEQSEIENNLKIVKALIKITGENGLQTSLASNAFISLKEEMNNILNISGITSLGQADFNLELKANSFDFGILRNGKFVSFTMLSTGEKMLYTLVFLSAIIMVSKSTYRVVMINDMFDMLDDDKFNTISLNINKLSDTLDIQYVFANVRNLGDDLGLQIKLT